MKYCKSFERLIENLTKLPGVGPKSAERMAYQLLDMDNFNVEEFNKAILDARTKIKRCKICGALSEEDTCEICNSDSRNKKIICVVQEPRDVYSIEKTNAFNGVYHVLGGAINPVNGIGPDQLRINELLERIKKGNVEEIILATNPTIEGETTALYLSKILEKSNIEVTRIAYGVPLGAVLDYTDEFTISKALEGRRKI